MEGIMEALQEAALTLRKGGGIGYDFSTLRPEGVWIEKLETEASGPISFMEMFDAMCGTIRSAGHRRGAQMGGLRVDHPDIEKFVVVKRDLSRLTNFNLSVLVTDEFMNAVKYDQEFALRWNGEVWKRIRARYLWNLIMESTWDYAEPGVLFVDQANRMNNLWYCEYLAVTNPCGEQWLPPYGACLLGSINLTKFLAEHTATGEYIFDYVAFAEAIPDFVRALDNVIDSTVYPLEAQRQEAQNKRRMGIGVTGLANTLEALGKAYGSREAIRWTEHITELLANYAYEASADLAIERGSFPYFDVDRYLQSEFVRGLWPETQTKIARQGIRNSHLVSIAPTGTISLSADNVSGGIEPPFNYGFTRDIDLPDGKRTEWVGDYAAQHLGVYGTCTEDLEVEDHVDMLLAAAKNIDSSVSKTCNVGNHVSFCRFKNVYMRAWEGGAKGCTTFRAAGKRWGVLRNEPMDNDEDQNEEVEQEGSACSFDPASGKSNCGD